MRSTLLVASALGSILRFCEVKRVHESTLFFRRVGLAVNQLDANRVKGTEFLSHVSRSEELGQDKTENQAAKRNC